MKSSSSTFGALAELRPYAIWEGVTARVVNGERMTLASVDLQPGAVVAEHHHENEQLGFVISGTLTFKVGDEERELRAGDTYAIPSDVPHGGVAGPDGCTVCDVFAPIRADWAQLTPKEPSRPNWP